MAFFLFSSKKNIYIFSADTESTRQTLYKLNSTPHLLTPQNDNRKPIISANKTRF